MDTFKSGQPFSLTFSLEGPAGVLTPTAMQARVFDELGAVLGQPVDVALPEAGARSVTLAMPPFFVPEGQLRIARGVTLELVLDTGDFHIVEREFLVEAQQLLVPGQTTFITYLQAMSLAAEYTEATLASWTNATAEDRKRSLSESFNRLRNLDVVIDWENNQSVIRDTFFDPPRLRDLTPEQILALDARLLAALKRAQLIECNAMLTPDPVREWRAQGIQSMTVGESSQFFGAVKPLTNGGVSADTARLLSKWLRSNKRIARA